MVWSPFQCLSRSNEREFKFEYFAFDCFLLIGLMAFCFISRYLSNSSLLTKASTARTSVKIQIHECNLRCSFSFKQQRLNAPDNVYAKMAIFSYSCEIIILA